MTHPVHHLPDPQGFAVDQERQRHEQALYRFGEYAMFVLMWNLLDHERGLVARCPTCYESYGKTAEAYGQSAVQDCPDCFGTTFEGGYKARIVRPALWDFNEEDYREAVRGLTVVATATIQSTSDFRLRTGDHVFRADGTRWLMRTVSTNHLRTGFEMPNRDRTALGYNYGQVNRQDETSVAFLIPPDAATLTSALDIPGTRYPADFSAIEDVRGPLL